MTPLTDIIAEVIGDAIADCAQIREGIGGPETAEVIRRYAEAAADAWDEARWIRTTEQLRAITPTPDLIAGALIKAFGAPALGGVYELNDDGTWNNFDGTKPADERTPPEQVPLPALLIHHPEWKTTR